MVSRVYVRVGASDSAEYNADISFIWTVLPLFVLPGIVHYDDHRLFYGRLCTVARNFADFSLLSKLVMSVGMLAGRLEFYPILLLFSPYMWKKT